MRGLVLGSLAVALAACSSSAGEPLVEYPDVPAATSPDPARTATPAPSTPPPPPAPEPTPQPGMTKLWDSVTWIRGVTTDGHVLATKDNDLVVLASGATQPTTLVTDYDAGTDEDLVRGKLVSVWLGEDVFPSPITTWSSATGLVKGGPVAYRGMVHPKPGADLFAFRGKASSSLASKLSVTRPGQGDGAVIVPSLDNGVIDEACAPTIAWIGADLLVAGCVGGATSPSVGVYAADGSGKKLAVLDGAARGVWLNRARTRAVVQTTTASSLRALAAGGSPLPLDGRLVRALFSADDAKVVYLRADGKLRRAATSDPVAPVDLATATALLAASDDARWAAFATKSDASTQRTDVWLVDAQGGSPPRKLADEKAILWGFAKNGAAIVHQTTTDSSASGPLFVTPTAGGPAVQVSADAWRVVFDGEVLYFQELTGATPKTMTLKAVRASAPQTALVVADNLDPLTTHIALPGSRLLVASKVGLWSYPVVTP